MSVPYTFATAVGTLPLSELDSNFATPITLGETNVSLGGSYNTLSSLQINNFKTTDVTEVINLVSSAPTSTTNYYIASGAVQYYTSNTANNWTLNIAYSASISLNTQLSVGDSICCTLLVVNGSTAYYPNVIKIDGTTVTPNWQGGTAPSAGNVSSIDSYSFAIVKTASATYTVLASQTKFA